ncbi:hypothetical protein HYW55_01975 [Candidatus Gottesmanbacteria bacterium]|nr:hypothetical protein [Candidatus Gottesmanbacteria bacterium]
MPTSTVKTLPKATVEITITIPWSDIAPVYEKYESSALGEVEIAGFRKGKAPKEIALKHLNKTRIYEAVVKDVIPNAYAESVTANKLTPISSPKIEVSKAKENEDWVVIAKIATKPEIHLKDYKEKVRTLKKGKVKIWTPGSKEEKDGKGKLSVEEIMEALVSEADVEISDILIADEANRLLSNLVDQTQQLGLTVEQYLLAKGKTSEQIRAEYATQATHNLKIELILSEIADKENITVTQKDIDTLVEKVEKPEEREKLKKESYYLAHLIRQQKTLEFLNTL